MNIMNDRQTKINNSPNATRDAVRAFDPELRQADEDWNNYLNNSPAPDGSGRLRDGTGKFAASRDKQREDHEAATAVAGEYSQKSISELAKLFGEAESQNDKTRSVDIELLINEKIEAQVQDLHRRKPELSVDELAAEKAALEDRYHEIASNEIDRIENPENSVDTLQDEVLKEVTDSIDNLEETDKEHDSEIASLKSENDELRKRIEQLEKALNPQGEQDSDISDNPKNNLRIEDGDIDIKYPKDLPEQSSDQEDPFTAKDQEKLEGLLSKEESKPGKEIELWRGEEGVPDKLQGALETATGKYAELSAKHRKSHFGHLLRNSKYIVKIPGMKGLAETLNGFTDRHLDTAREEYEKAVQDIQVAMAKQMEFEGVPLEEIRATAAQFRRDHESKFEAEIVAERTKQSKDTNRFVDWWVRQEGWRGRVGKALVVGGAGVAAGASVATVGLVAGVALPVISSAAAGGVAGAWVGSHVTRRRANAFDREGRTVAQKESAEDLAKKEAHYASLAEGGFSETSHDGYVDITEDSTAKSKRGNRVQFVTTTIGGAAAGKLGGSIVEGIGDILNKPVPSEATIDSPDLPIQEKPEILGNSFTVEAGNGYTHELIDFAQANGHNLSPQQAWDLHNNLVNRFGGDYIDIVNQSVDTYIQNGDHRLSAPGAASWDPGVSDAIKQWMTAKGLW